MSIERDEFGLPIRQYVSPFPSPKPAEPVEKIESSTEANTTNGIDGSKAVQDVVSGEKPVSTQEKATPTVEPTKTDGTSDKPQDVGIEKSNQVTKAQSKPVSVQAQDNSNETESAQTPMEQFELEEQDKPSPASPESQKPSHTRTDNAESSKSEPSNQMPDTRAPIEDKHTPSKANQETPESPSRATHNRSLSEISDAPREGVSEFSHQKLPSKVDEKSGNDDEWQTMPSYARYDMYDDDDKLVAKEFDPEEEEKYTYGGLGGAGKGYTRVLLDDDAESQTSMDDNTQYLFRPTNGTSAVEDDEGRDAVTQMQATKDLLTEGQRIAYVGVVRLEVVKFVAEAESQESTRKTRKEVGTSAEAMMMWGQKMMIRLYSHMEISEAEQVMIEQLADHGVMPQDLTPALTTNARVSNPMAETPASTPGTPRTPGTPGTPSQLSVDEKVAEVPPPYEATEGDELADVKTPSQLPTSAKIDIDLRWTILCDLFLILIADSIYDSRSRVLLERVAQSLDISWIDICRFEKKVTDALEMQQAADKENWNEEDHTESRRKRALKRRYVMMGLATVGGGLVIGLSAGLLAPVIGAGLATGLTAIGVTGTSGFLGGVGGAAIITSGAAASGSVIGVRAANRRTGAVKTFEYRPLHNNKRVNLIVTVSGWLTGKVDDVRLPFSTVDPIMGDLYSVLWEPELLRSMGDTMNILATEVSDTDSYTLLCKAKLTPQALTQGLQQVLATTILSALLSALQLPIILTKLSYLIDNPWAVSLDRATAAGKILADSLIERNLGTRPITLVGYSIGARVIFACLQELCKKSAYGVVQNVYLFGAPVVVKKEEFIRAKTVVSGRFVNAYNRNDWILGYLFRLTSGGIRRVAGLGPVEECPWLENIDVTDIVVGHMDYRQQMPSLLIRCGWSVENEEFAEIEDPDPENHAERQRELINEIEEARKELEKEGKKKGRFSIFGRRKNLEKQDWEIYEDKKGKEAAEAKEKGEDNTGVLFDIDAIRAELAKDARGENMEELQVREIKSTLPPMKLDMSSLPSSPSMAAQNRDGGPMRESYEPRVSQERSRSYTPSYTKPTSPPDYSAAYGGGFGSGYNSSRSKAYDMDRQDDEVQMTFDTSFDDARPTTAPPKDETPTRPEIKTSQTLPTITLRDPWNDPDDEDFGKEKEMTMTFA